jgi:hypothetical protein
MTVSVTRIASVACCHAYPDREARYHAHVADMLLNGATAALEQDTASFTRASADERAALSPAGTGDVGGDAALALAMLCDRLAL